MAIEFARIEIVSRSGGGSACCKGAYNARTKIKDNQTNITYNFSDRGDNVYHAILLPDHVNKKFKSTSVLMNEIEKRERRKNSQLLKDIVIALPDDKELNLQDRINITHRIVDKMEWVNEGLGVQINIHQPHDGEKNWHAHLLVTTRRFTEDGLALGEKARDLNPEFKSNKDTRGFIIPEEQIIHIKVKDVINEYFKELGLENRVDEIGSVPQEHVGPVRMRSILNQAILRNEERKTANFELVSDGAGILKKITKHRSVFSKKDLSRVVKFVKDKDKAETLVQEALKFDNVIILYHGDGKDSKLYTTKEIRAEELKLMRLGNCIRKQKNIISEQKKVADLVQNDKLLSKQQQDSLTHVLLNKGGIRILKGRAGTGKSYVLGKIVSIANSVGKDVIGLAPTHKAKLELNKVGYEKCDTVKGFLFKLYNGKADLATGSLIVVDEAGMIGNADYLELLRVANIKKCNVILSGDEKQLSSVERGGMFGVYADRFGFFELNEIRRQKVEWGKQVALSFAEERIKDGVNILIANNRLSSKSEKIDSLEALLTEWGKSKYDLINKLIIAIKNSDVDILNAGARTILQCQGKLKGFEWIRDKDVSFMSGERIVFTEKDWHLGINNGDFGTLVRVNKDEFKVELDRRKEIAFNPNEFTGFKHGYASTIYKAQGASIKDVYVFHDGFATMRSSYVAMSRHIEDVHFYTNTKTTQNMDQLIKQLCGDQEYSASLNYLTQEDLKPKVSEASKGLFAKIRDKIENKIIALSDRYKVNKEYYIFEKQEISQAKVDEVLEQVPILENEVRAVVGGYSHNVSTNMTTKNRFYANVDHQHNKETGRQDLKSLRQAAEHSIERITNHLLGEPNKHLSSSTSFRYGKYGKLAVKISGDKAGNWYDFSQNKGGDIFALIQNRVGCDFKEAVSYLQNTLGVGTTTHLRIVHDHEINDKYVDHNKRINEDKAAETAKIKKVENLCDRAKNIEKNTVSYRYLAEIRGIDCDLGKDIKTCFIFEPSLNKSIPAIVAFVRDTKGNITGGHQILLDAKTNNKADISAPKRSFGKIAGSFIEVAKGSESNNMRPLHIEEFLEKTKMRTTAYWDVCEDRKSSFDDKITNMQRSHITIIAEGLETALSIKQAVIDAKILCSLGISNIKNYVPQDKKEIVIIAADNDGTESITNKTITEAKDVLAKHPMIITVKIVKPEQIGDFNDVLRIHDGTTEIKKAFGPVIQSLTAKTLEEFFDNSQLTDQVREDLTCIRKYSIAPVREDKILNAFKKDYEQGAQELSNTKDRILFAGEAVYDHHTKIFEDIEAFGGTVNKEKVVEALINVPKNESLHYLDEIRTQALHNHITNQRYLFNEMKSETKALENTFEVIIKEQKLLSGLLKNHKDAMLDYIPKDPSVYEAAKIAHEKPDLLHAMLKISIEVQDKKIMPESEIVSTLKSTYNIETIYTTLDKACEDHHIKTNLEELNNAKEQAKTPKEALSIIDKEQTFLASLHDNLKYPDQQQPILDSIAQAHQLQNDKDNILPRLHEVIQQSLRVGAKTEKSILKDLKTTTDLKTTYISLDRAHEDHYTKTTLEKFAQAKERAQIPEAALDILVKEQTFLANLHTNLKYPDQQDQFLLNSISQAHEKGQDRDDIIPELYELMQQTLEIGAKPEDKILEELKTTMDFKTIYVSLDKACEDHHIKTNLEKLSNAKQQAKTPEEALSIIDKEQTFLAGLYNNLKYPYQQQPLLDPITQAHRLQNDKDNIASKIQEIFPKIVSKSQSADIIAQEDNILKDVKTATNLKAAYTTLCKVYKELHISDYLEKFSTAKEEAKTPEEVLNIITKEQNFLIGFHGNLKYSEQPGHLLTQIRQADEAQTNEIIPKLHEINQKFLALDRGMWRRFVLEELRSSTNLNEIYVDLDKSYEDRYIKTNLKEFSDDKEKAKTPEDTLAAIHREHYFLVWLHGNLKYPEQQEHLFLDQIREADEGIRNNNVIHSLYKAVAYIQEHQIMSPQSLMKSLKENEDANVTENDLTKTCKDHYSNIVNKNLGKLLNDYPIEFNKQIFDCPIKYLTYEIKNPPHAYADINRFKKSIPRIQEMVHKMEKEKEMEHTIGGMLR